MGLRGFFCHCWHVVMLLSYSSFWLLLYRVEVIFECIMNTVPGTHKAVLEVAVMQGGLGTRSGG